IASSVCRCASASGRNAPEGMPSMYLNITIDTYVVASTREVSTAWSKSSLHFAFPRAHLAEARIAVANAKGEPEVAPLFRVASRHIDDTLSQSLDVGHLTGLILDVDRRIEHPDREVWLSDGIDELDVLRCELRGLANPGANRQLDRNPDIPIARATWSSGRVHRARSSSKPVSATLPPARHAPPQRSAPRAMRI